MPGKVNMQKICLIDNDTDRQRLVVKELSDWFDVILVGSIKEALAVIETRKFDLILLEVSLPDGSGFELCVKLKAFPVTKDVPLIFLTDRADPLDKMMGFAVGADDYVVRPFEPIEFRARIGARLRNRQAPELLKEAHCLADFKFDLVQRRAMAINGLYERDMRLTPFEFKLLHLFATHPGHVFDRAEIQKRLNAPNLHVSEDGIYTHISALKKKMAEKKDYLQCIPRVGYRFCLPEIIPSV
jgi:DNA-binding response OmpR family regulator